MKKLIFVGFIAAAMAACGGSPKDDPEVVKERDSLNHVISQKDGELNDILLTMNEIEDNLKRIGEAEGRVTVAKQGEGASQSQRIKEDLEFIQNTMEANRKLVAKLQGQLKNSKLKSAQLQKAIDQLNVQIAEKDSLIGALRQSLGEKNVHIAKLDTRIEALNTDVDSLKGESIAKSGVIQNQDKQIHAAWFVFGTKSELKAQKILEDGKVLEGDFNHNYFTEIDIRKEKEIKLYSKSAEMLTSHPASSYKLERDNDKKYVLRITDPDTFWSTSKYLVIQVR